MVSQLILLIGTASQGDEKSLEWEKEFSNVMDAISTNMTDVNVYYSAFRRYNF
jgi:hypothetical protein